MYALFRGFAGMFWLGVSGLAFLFVAAAVRHELREFVALIWGR